jgi:hypothetical protein
LQLQKGAFIPPLLYAERERLTFYRRGRSSTDFSAKLFAMAKYALMQTSRRLHCCSATQLSVLSVFSRCLLPVILTATFRPAFSFPKRVGALTDPIVLA